MTRIIRAVVFIGAAAVTLPVAVARAQAPQPPSPRPAPAAEAPAPPSPRPRALPLKVDVTLVKYRNGREVTRLPYSLSVGADGGRASLRMGTDVIVGDGDNRLRQQIGTYIDCQASALGDGRFQLLLSINDSSPYPSKPAELQAFGDVPLIRSLVATNQVLTLRDGQTQEFVAATDKLTAEVTKAEVTLTVEK
jgi:hypothetical protein